MRILITHGRVIDPASGRDEAADVAITGGRIVGIGKAGNPDTMTGVHPALVIGPSTEIMAGNGRILTAANVDPAWVNFDAATFFTAKLGRPAVVVNDADAAGIEEITLSYTFYPVDKPKAVTEAKTAAPGSIAN